MRNLWTRAIQERGITPMRMSDQNFSFIISVHVHVLIRNLITASFPHFGYWSVRKSLIWLARSRFKVRILFTGSLVGLNNVSFCLENGIVRLEDGFGVRVECDSKSLHLHNLDGFDVGHREHGHDVRRHQTRWTLIASFAVDQNFSGWFVLGDWRWCDLTPLALALIQGRKMGIDHSNTLWKGGNKLLIACHIDGATFNSQLSCYRRSEKFRSRRHGIPNRQNHGDAVIFQKTSIPRYRYRPEIQKRENFLCHPAMFILPYHDRIRWEVIVKMDGSQKLGVGETARLGIKRRASLKGDIHHAICIHGNPRDQNRWGRRNAQAPFLCSRMNRVWILGWKQHFEAKNHKTWIGRGGDIAESESRQSGTPVWEISQRVRRVETKWPPIR